MSDLEEHERCCLLLPTGAGKTEVFIDIAKRFVAQHRQNVLVLSHLSILTTQTINRFALRAPEVQTGVLQANVIPHVLSKVIVSTMQSSRDPRKAEYIKRRLPREIGLIIVDEAHHIQTESYQKVMEFFPNAKVLGVTATPFRSNQIMTNFFDKISFSLSTQYMIDNDYLVPPKLFQIVRESNEITDIMASVVDIYRQREMGKNAIVFMKTIKDAKAIRNVFEDVGIKAESITSNVTGEYRDEIIERFNRGDIKVLTTCDVLSAGFDSPVVESIFMPHAVGSTTKYLQRVGRGLRKHDAGGKTDCRVYVFGSAPSISKKYYEKIANRALNAGGEVKEYEKVTDTLDFNDWDGANEEYYTWTKQVAEAVGKMQKAGMTTLSQMLNEKSFPARFLQNIEKFLPNLPSSKSPLPHGEKAATEAQRGVLRKYDFKENQLDKINKGEASMLISAIFGKINTAYTIQSGKFAGRHVSELPWAYRNYVLNNMPQSPVAKMIRDYQGRKNGTNSQNHNQTTRSVRNA
jgi:superfamily II DNA or RNA helicase